MKYIIDEKELRELLYSQYKLDALEYGGVDNWEWYGDSIADFLDYALGADKYSRNSEGIEMLVEKEIEAYEQFQEI